MPFKNINKEWIGKSVEDLAELKAVDVTGYIDGTIRNVLTMSPAGGTFIWDSLSSVAADDINYVKPTSVVGDGRWKRLTLNVFLINASGKIDPSILPWSTPLQFKGEINVAADFPALASVQDGWAYFTQNSVTDNDPTKTNTGQTFPAKQYIAWKFGTPNKWINLSGADLWMDTGTVTKLITARDIDLQNKKIVNLLDPSLDQDAATKKYVDTKIGSFPLPSTTQIVYVNYLYGDDATGTGAMNAPVKSIQKALTLITDASQTKPYVIYLQADRQIETGDVFLKPYTFVVGMGQRASYLRINGGELKPDASFGATSGWTGIYNLYYGGSSTINWDLQALGGSNCVFILDSVTTTGALTFKGRNAGGGDYLESYVGIMIGALNLDSTFWQIQSMEIGAPVIITNTQASALSGTFRNVCFDDNVSIGAGSATATVYLEQNNFCDTANTLTTVGTVAIQTDARALPPKSRQTLSVGTTITYTDDISNDRYTPTTPSDWPVVPVSSQQALDYLAATSTSENLFDRTLTAPYTITPHNINDNLDFLSGYMKNGNVVFKGVINVAADFPTPTTVINNDMYFVATNVTDNDPAKTNTGLSFVAPKWILWKDTSWVTSDASTFNIIRTIAVASDFPTLAEVKNEWAYAIKSNVTDNDPTKTNTGLSFTAGQLIWWSTAGATWTIPSLSTVYSGNIEYGTKDSFGRFQFWHHMPNSIFRLGSLGGDGDPSSTSSEGMIVYGQNAQSDPMTRGDFSYLRFKPTHIGIYNGSTTAGQYTGYLFRADTATNEFYLRDNAGNKTFEVDRATGNTKSKIFQSTITTGTAPLTVASTTVVSNLNADTVDGEHSSAFLHLAGAEAVIGVKTFNATTGIPVYSAAPTFTPGSNEFASIKYVDDAVRGENLWDRTSTTLSPHTANDSVNIGTGLYTGGNLAITNNVTGSQNLATFLAPLAGTGSGGTLRNIIGLNDNNCFFSGYQANLTSQDYGSFGVLSTIGGAQCEIRMFGTYNTSLGGKIEAITSNNHPFEVTTDQTSVDGYGLKVTSSLGIANGVTQSNIFGYGNSNNIALTYTQNATAATRVGKLLMTEGGANISLYGDGAIGLSGVATYAGAPTFTSGSNQLASCLYVDTGDAATIKYFGSSTADGSWRIDGSSTDLVIQRRESGSWVTKATITAA